MPTSDELADTLFKRHSVTGEAVIVNRDELRALARDAAKQALNDLADYLTTLSNSDMIVNLIRARAEQIGEGK